MALVRIPEPSGPPLDKEELWALIATINRDYGDGTALIASEAPAVIPRVPSGSLSLDLALGGGWPANQWQEIVGNESSGKTVLALKSVAANQAIDPNWTCLWIDAEHSYDKEWWEANGVDMDRIVLVSTNIMEEAYEIALVMAQSRQVDGIVIDSLPALSPNSEDEKAINEVTVGLGALLTNRFFRKQNHATRRSLVVEDRLITGWLINQWRSKIGISFGDPRTTPGGMGKNFACYTRVEVRRDEWIKDGTVPVGITIKVVNIKNKSAPPGRIGVFDFYFIDSGIHTKGELDRCKDVMNVAIEAEVLTKAGNTFSFNGEKVGVGRPGVIEAMRTNPKLEAAMTEQVMNMFVITEPEPVAVPRKLVRKKQGGRP
jgi:recombination protein RecA